MTKTTPEQNKTLVLEAFDTLFNKRAYDAAARFWSDTYVQHSAHIEPGRDGLFSLVRSARSSLRYEHQLIVAEGDYVIAQRTLLRNGPTCCLGRRRHCKGRKRPPCGTWDVLQDEATKAESKSGLPMFGNHFPA